ncbi:S8/S53 family peptidase [Ramlibacter tataouinensis]|uniref:S8 family peptidase n=1 Tax=Ramlibacter tataouinensis TaxID=94132 RepID=UPI0022F3EDCC|nr:S8/S53 family peptidase [Ramlibacter tataouinensis]WBY02915.1 S8/S53 family peptidase [Ramlibacter tataouinensis]
MRLAGAVDWQRVTETEALDLLLRRDPALLPPKPGAPLANPLWHLDMVRARDAWGHWGGPEGIDWGTVRVGQIDTGYTSHPVFGFPDHPWIDSAGGQTIFAPGPGAGGAGPGSGIDPLQDQMDGHGTRVASVICGHDPVGPGSPYLGVAPRVPLVPVRIANHVLISHAQRELASALDYLVGAGVSVINLSMGFLPRLQMGVLDRAIDRAYEAGVIFVCAAGQPLSSVISPAHGRRTIAVAGCTRDGVPWGESAYGSAVDWTAPASAISRAQTSPGGHFGYAGTGDGTSYAAAVTSAAAALWLARRGLEVKAAYPHPWQWVEAFKVVAKATAKPMPNQRPGSFGAGILDIGALLDEALPPASALGIEAPA